MTRVGWTGYLCSRCGQISIGARWCQNPACARARALGAVVELALWAAAIASSVSCWLALNAVLGWWR